MQPRQAAHHTNGRTRDKSAVLLAVLSLAILSGCALITATPPQIEVVQVQVRAGDILHQALDLSLCVTNPNDTELTFRRVRVGLDIAGAPLADGETIVPVRLPPRAATLVPVSVVTTTTSIGTGLAQLLQTGGIDYRVRGSVQLEGPVGLTLPFSRRGRLDVLSAATMALADNAASRGTACGTPQ